MVELLLWIENNTPLPLNCLSEREDDDDFEEGGRGEADDRPTRGKWEEFTTFPSGGDALIIPVLVSEVRYLTGDTPYTVPYSTDVRQPEVPEDYSLQMEGAKMMLITIRTNIKSHEKRSSKALNNTKVARRKPSRKIKMLIKAKDGIDP